ncbi:hypothetical protein GCM10027396_25740 [Insolitispirillum peregrinum]
MKEADVQEDTPERKNKRKETRDTLIAMVNDETMKSNFPTSADWLQHYLEGDGTPKVISAESAQRYPGTPDGEKGARGHYDEWFHNDRGDKKIGSMPEVIQRFIQSGEKKVTLDKKMEWDGSGSVSFVRWATDQGSALGDVTIKGSGPLTIERKENGFITITGDISFHLSDKYDFSKEGAGGNIMPSSIYAGKLMFRDDVAELEKNGEAKPFEVESGRWGRQVTATYKIDQDGEPVLIKRPEWGKAYQIDP